MAIQENIKAVLILDIIGRPPEHLVKMLEDVIGDMGKEKGVIVKSKSIKEPAFMKDNKEFYTTFAEVEVEVEDIRYLAGLMFKYMPAHIEVISPENISIQNNGWSEILSEIVRNLHSYDEVARIMQIDNQKLIKKVIELGGKVIQEQLNSKEDKVNEKIIGKSTERKTRKKKKAKY